jgi:flagellar L-ring protein precursor FlgH
VTKLPLLAAVGALALLTGCNAATRLQQIGEAPPLTTIQDPVRQPGYQPVSMPMPQAINPERRPNSLWQSGTRAFFKDQRASQIGDILTVLVDIDDEATIDNETQRRRAGSEGLGVPAFFGFEDQVQAILPNAADMSNLVEASSNSNVTGRGQINRQEEIRLRVATTVTQVLPNGNLVIQGRQEVRVNFEVRELQITGVIRPQDIGATNTIALDKIAEARVSYGGRGHIHDAQQPRYGQQFLDIVAPF